MKFWCLVLLLCAPLLNASKFEDVKEEFIEFDNYKNVTSKLVKCTEFRSIYNDYGERSCDPAKLQLPGEFDKELRFKFIRMLSKCKNQSEQGKNSKLILNLNTYENHSFQMFHYEGSVSSKCLEEKFNIKCVGSNKEILDEAHVKESPCVWFSNSEPTSSRDKYSSYLIIKEN